MMILVEFSDRVQCIYLYCLEDLSPTVKLENSKSSKIKTNAAKVFGQILHRRPLDLPYAITGTR